jgi:hypothetical protein
MGKNIWKWRIFLIEWVYFSQRRKSSPWMRKRWRMFLIGWEFYSYRSKFSSCVRKICIKLKNVSHWIRILFSKKEIFFFNRKSMYQSGEPFSLKENIFLKQVIFFLNRKKMSHSGECFLSERECFSQTSKFSSWIEKRCLIVVNISC